MYRKTYVEIDCNKLEENIRKIKEYYNGYKYYFGVVKNNAYGVGIESVQYLIQGGINYLAVSSLEEAIAIRNDYKDIPILILEPISLEGVPVASKENITITIDDKEYFDAIKSLKLNLKYHLKIDSGMNRFGVKDENDATYICQNSDKHLFLEGIYTHLATGSISDPLYEKEINQFKEITKNIDLTKIEIIHLDRSLTLEQHKKIDFANGCRLGIIMYGFNQGKYTPSLKRRIFNKLTFKKIPVNEYNLKLDFVFKFKTNIIEIKTVNAGEIIGYNGMYKADEPIKIALLPYGFADYLFIHKSQVSINDKLYNIIVNYMDITAIIIDESIKVGDEVEIFGDKISIRQVAKETGENAYKIMASISNRVPRVYKYKDTIKEIKY